MCIRDRLCGGITKRLKNFSHKYSNRYFEWDIAQSLWVENHLSLFDSEEKDLLYTFLTSFKNNIISTEHGPDGGDEINKIKFNKNSMYLSKRLQILESITHAFL